MTRERASRSDKMLSLPGDVHTALTGERDRLAGLFGFTPTYAQVIMHLIKLAADRSH